MTPVIVDSNVLLDVITDDATWGAWSSESLERLADEAILVINALSYAEVSIGFASIEELEEALPRDVYRREHLPYEAGFLAGKAFLRYRQAGGVRRSPLPGFYVGAHAAVAGYRLLTRDATRYRTHVPTVELITPAAGASARSPRSRKGGRQRAAALASTWAVYQRLGAARFVRDSLRSHAVPPAPVALAARGPIRACR